MASAAKGNGSRVAVWIILLLLILGLAGFGATNFGGSIRSIGTVGDSEIDLRRYSRDLQQEVAVLSQRIGTNISFAQAQQAGIDRQVLQRLVSFVALEDEADKLGLSIGDAVVRDQLLNSPQFQGIDGTFDREGYRFVLERSGQTETEYEDSLRAEISRSILQATVISGAETPETFLGTIFDFELEERSFIWGRVTADLLDEPVGDPTDADLQAHYDANPDAFIAWSYPPDSFGLAEQAIIEDLDVRIYYSAVATSFPAFSEAFGSKIDNVLGAGGTNVDDPKIAEYRAAHEQLTGKVADYWASANTYAALQVLEQAIEGADTLDRETVTQYIKDNPFDTVMGTLTFENQNSATFWSVGQWQDGVFRGVKGSNVDGAVPVRLKEGWN